MKYVWEDLPERKNCFTVRNTTMINLNTGKTIRHYSTNTRITVVQRCITPKVTYYRTADAAIHNLNYAFEAAAFGLPNEIAPSAPSVKPDSSNKSSIEMPKPRKQTTAKKQTVDQNNVLPNDGEEGRKRSWISRLLRRFHAKTKNS